MTAPSEAGLIICGNCCAGAKPGERVHWQVVLRFGGLSRIDLCSWDCMRGLADRMLSLATEGTADMTEPEIEAYAEFRGEDGKLFSFPFRQRTRLSEMEGSVAEAEQRAADATARASQARAAFGELVSAAGGDKSALYEDVKRTLWGAAQAVAN